MTQPMLAFVMSELQARKGHWPTIAKAMSPEAWKSYYSWLCKLAQGHIPDPSVNKIQALADYFESNPVYRGGYSSSAPRNGAVA